MRPFVCDGSPYDWTAFVVGINPVSSVTFWPFWNDETGSNRPAWLECYRDHRKAEPLKLNHTRRQPISSTRQRIEWIVEVASPVKILETNLYALPTRKAADLGRADRASGGFEFLLAEISPSVILLHVREVQKEFAKLYGYAAGPESNVATINGRTMRVAAVPLLSRASRAWVTALGECIRSGFWDWQTLAVIGFSCGWLDGSSVWTDDLECARRTLPSGVIYFTLVPRLLG
jgi:hypothetical protein